MSRKLGAAKIPSIVKTTSWKLYIVTLVMVILSLSEMVHPIVYYSSTEPLDTHGFILSMHHDSIKGVLSQWSVDIGDIFPRHLNTDFDQKN
jgi:hypothetical protein